MRAITFLLAIFLAVVPSMPVFAADEEPEPSLGENESYITLPLGYNAEQNTYYFSDIEQYCGQYAPNTDAPTAGVSWYSGSYPDEDARLVGGPSIFDCTEQNTIDLNGVEGHSPTLDGERTIVIDNGEHRYILKYSVEDDVLTSAGSPPFSLDAPFTPVRDDEGEHRLLSATVENNILKLDQSSCDLLLSGVGGRLSHPDELWAFDKAIWMAFKEPAESGAYDADHWPSIADSRNLYPMVDDGNPETMGTPVCYGDGVPELPYYLNYWDLEDPHYYTPTDGTLKFFVWAATHNRPGFNGQPLRSNAKPIGYVSVTRVDGTWYLTADAPPPALGMSNVMFLPGIKSSRLYNESGKMLWTPWEDEDTRELFVDAGNTIYAHRGEVLDSIGGSDYYASFINDMDLLEISGNIADWEPVAYDWRLSLSDIVNNGAEAASRISYTTETTSPFIEQTLKRLAASSKSGKVTIIAHSNGGLVAKALLQRIKDEYGEEEVSRLVDKVILVGVPQTGAPRSIGGLLFGYGEALPFDSCAENTFVPWNACERLLSRDVARQFAEHSPMAYHLLPSQAYFDSEDDGEHPVISFKDGVHVYTEQYDAYGETIGDFDTLAAFLGGEEGREKPATEDIGVPNVLNASLLEYAKEEHAVIDNWAPPADVQVYQIAGWGDDNTVAGIKFFESKSLFGGYRKLYEPIFTEDGDGVVPVPSALYMGETGNVSRYWINLDQYEAAHNFSSRDHADILEISELRVFIKEILDDSFESLPEFIIDQQPDSNDTNKKLRFFLHSPLALSLYDEYGNHTGMTEEGSFSEGISNATYDEFGEVKYITAPAGNKYLLVLEGESDGEFTLKIDETIGDTIINSSVIEAVPTTPETIVTLSIENGVEDASPLEVDQDNDGIIDFSVAFSKDETVTYADWKEPEPELEPSPEVSLEEENVPSGGWSAGKTKKAEIVLQNFFTKLADSFSLEVGNKQDVAESQSDISSSTASAIEETKEISAYHQAQSASAYASLSQQGWFLKFTHSVYSGITSVADLIKGLLTSIISFVQKIL